MRREATGVTESLLQAVKEKPAAWSERIALRAFSIVVKYWKHL